MDSTTTSLQSGTTVSYLDISYLHLVEVVSSECEAHLRYNVLGGGNLRSFLS